MATTYLAVVAEVDIAGWLFNLEPIMRGVAFVRHDASGQLVALPSWLIVNEYT